MQALRASILDQLDAVRRQLSLVPEALAAGPDEDTVVGRQVEPATFEPAKPELAEQASDTRPTAVERAEKVLRDPQFAADAATASAD